MSHAQDDLPLMANTSHIFVRHYTLDLDVCFESHVFTGRLVLFLEPGINCKKSKDAETCPLQPVETCRSKSPSQCQDTVMDRSNFDNFHQGELGTYGNTGPRGKDEHVSGISSSKGCCDTEKHDEREEFVMVLDCCDLSVLEVEEVDVAAVLGIENLTRAESWPDVPEEAINFGNHIVHELVSLPAHRWREQHDYYTRCSQASRSGTLQFTTDTWSLKIKKAGSYTPREFPHAIRILYKTKPEGKSVRWTKDQCSRPCVYTVGSHINNRALFPCQEPPVAMSTWQSTIRAATSFVVLMSGENVAEPQLCQEAGLSSWFYFVTMPMPASTFTIAVGCWAQVEDRTRSGGVLASLTSLHPSDDSRLSTENCSHVAYPCRLSSAVAAAQAVIPHRLFAPPCLLDRCQKSLLPLLPQCLAAAQDTLGTHPFSRLDVLIVPSNFSSLGMAR